MAQILRVSNLFTVVVQILPGIIYQIVPLQITNLAKSLYLTSSHRRPYKHAISFGTADRRVSKRAFRFVYVLAGALSTRHACRAIVALDLYTRNHFSESVGSRFGGPGQKALAAMNLSKTCSFDVPAKNL